MRVTILPYAIILTKACKAVVSMITKGCFLFLLPYDIHVYAIVIQ